MRKRLLLVPLLIAGPAYGQAAVDLQQRIEAMQARSTLPSSTVSPEDTSERDSQMQEHLKSLVLDGKCNEARQEARKYGNGILIRAVRKSCGKEPRPGDAK